MKRRKRTPPVFYITGTKGGVGKSLVTMGLTDYLLYKRQDKVLLIESDLHNSDVGKTYSQHVDIFKEEDLDDADGWIGFMNHCQAYPDHHIVVNAGARDRKGLERHGTMVQDLTEIGRRFIAMWVINAQRDSVELLTDYWVVMREPDTEQPIGKIHVICNAGESYREKFPLFTGSDIEADIKSNDGRVAIFPTLAKRVVDTIYNDRIPISVAKGQIPYGNYAELRRWKGVVNEMLSKVLIDDL